MDHVSTLGWQSKSFGRVEPASPRPRHGLPGGPKGGGSRAPGGCPAGVRRHEIDEMGAAREVGARGGVMEVPEAGFEVCAVDRYWWAFRICHQKSKSCHIRRAWVD